jgi:hypothetical protein
MYKAPAVVDSKPILIVCDEPKDERKEMIEQFIKTFEEDKKRLPTTEEIQDNIDQFLPHDLIESLISDIDNRKKNDIYSSIA